MIPLKSLIVEMTTNLMTYHRSMEDFKPGQVIGNHPKPHYQSDWFEIAMEAYRVDRDKNKLPSRMTGVFSAFIPRSRFVDRGHLYMVRPQGKILITNSQYIDDARRKFDDKFYGSYSYDQIYRGKKPSDLSADGLMRLGWEVQGYPYWDGANVSRQNISDMEVLSDTAVVIERIPDDPRRLKVKEAIQVTENDKIPASFALYFDYDTHDGAEKKNRKFHTGEEMDAFATDVINHLFSRVDEAHKDEHAWGKPNNKTRTVRISGFLRKGALLKIGFVQSKLMYKDWSERGKYGQMMFDFFYNGRWYEKKNHPTENPSFSFDYTGWAAGSVKDIGKYLKRV